MYYNVKSQLIGLLQSIEEMVDLIGADKSRYRSFIDDCKMAAGYIETFVADYECAKIPVEKLRCVFELEFGEYFANKKDVRAICREIEGAIKDKIETRWRMFFLPYKYSMWYSMESIYEEAAKDPRCDAFVMPLPYRILNIDGSVQSYCYEIDEYKNCNVVSHKDVDIEGIQPEFIFIHNAYDGYNNLTRIDEKYFSANLKSMTDNLVYTPYYTFFDASKEACDRLMLQPGLINADYIVAQSSQVKSEYIKRGFSSKKIIALGSPKIDNVVNIKNTAPELPLEWKSKLDGRKVVLYTFALEACTRRDWILAIRDYMKVYWNDNDIALIFRPHPLVLQYAKVRNINLDVLKEIFDFSQEGDRIVLDTYTNPIYAYYYSDALMLSGTSSIINEYLAVGKPIYFDLLNFEITAKDDSLFVDLRSIYCPFYKDGENIVQAHEEGVSKFFNVVKGLTKDEKNDERNIAFKNGFVNYDGTAGKKIYEKLVRAY